MRVFLFYFLSGVLGSKSESWDLPPYQWHAAAFMAYDWLGMVSYCYVSAMEA